MRLQACLAAVCMAAFGMSISAQPVTREYKDLDGDGIDEVIIENEYLKVAVMTGEAPNPIPPPQILPNGVKLPYKYGNRFNWGGWIYDIKFKPTSRQWFVHQGTAGENWHGIPEEFEEAIPMKELEPGVFATLLPGIGTAVGRGRCFRGSLRDVHFAAWTLTEECKVDGVWRSVVKSDTVANSTAWRLTFTQKIDTEYGYGCEYKKVMTLTAGKSALETHRELKNTGTKDFQTTWFTHGFWGHGKDGSFDRDSWSIVPLRPPQIVGSSFPATLRDVEPGYARAFKPAYYWGPISREEIGGNWHATGNRANGDVFISAVSKDLAFFRIWTDVQTYSIEPFLEINLKAGQTEAWNTLRASGNGLWGVKNYGAGGLVDWSFANADNGAKLMTVKFLPYTKLSGSLTLKGQLESVGTIVKLEHMADCDNASPVKPWIATFTVPAKLAQKRDIVIRFSIVSADADEKSPALVKVDSSYRTDVVPRSSWSGNANGAKVVVLGETNKNDAGDWNHNNITKFWEQYLLDAGFSFSLNSATADGSDIDWNQTKLVVLASRRVSIKLLRQLEAFASKGGAIIVQGMIDFRQFELSDLLPISGIYGENSLHALSPRDGTREFENINAYRYHLKNAAGEHEITAGLPLYPESYQGIGAMQCVLPKPDAEVLVNFVSGRGLSDAGAEYPALVVKNYGKGKVAYFASPIAWGAPAACSMWGRLGEYHEKFFNQLALWMLK